MVRTHLKKSLVEDAFLADEHRLHRRLHVVVDAAATDPAEEPEAPLVGLEHHLLALARKNLNQKEATVAQPQVRRLDPHGGAGDHRILVTPVELVGLAGIEGQRDVGWPVRSRSLPAPGRRVTAHRIVAAVVAQAGQFLVDPHQRQAIAPAFVLVGFQQPVQLLDPGPQLRQRLNRAFIAQRRLVRAHHLAHRVAGQLQIPSDLLYRNAPAQVIPTNPRDGLHNQASPLTSFVHATK